MNLDEMMLKLAIDPSGALSSLRPVADALLPPFAVATLGEKAYSGAKGALSPLKQRFQTKMGELEAKVDPGESPTPATPTGFNFEPPTMMTKTDAGGLSLGNRLAAQETLAAKNREASERAEFSRQGMNYYAPGIGYKGEFAKPGATMSAFGQPYKATQGTVSNPVAKGGEYEKLLNHERDMRDLEMETQMTAGQMALASASLSPAQRARLEAMSKTRYTVNPVEQQAFAIGKRLADQRQAAIAKAIQDTNGDQERLAQALSRIDALFPTTYDTLLTNALGQRATQSGLLGGGIE